MVKDKVLNKLMECQGMSVSGQQLAELLGVSRNAVWKAIKALQQEGYEIVGVNNKGYALIKKSGYLNQNLIYEALEEKIPVHVFSEIDSTNTEAKRRINEGLNGPALFVAETQTNGRGRLGRTFYSPEKTGVYFTLAYPVEADFSSAVTVTAKTAVAVAEGMESIIGKTVSIKWVNDIYFAGKKVCGILTEAVSDFERQLVQYVIIGIGINVSTITFPKELEDKAGSLHMEEEQRNQLVAEIINRLMKEVKGLNDKSYLDSYRAHSCVLGKEVTYGKNQEWKNGIAQKIDDNGALVILCPDGSQEVLNSGEISLRLNLPKQS